MNDFNYEKIIQYLEAHADEQYKAFHQKLKAEGASYFYGVRIPILRKLAQEILKNNPTDFLAQNKFASYEEKVLYGFVLAKLKTDFKQQLAYLTCFIQQIDSWAICDVVDFKVTKKDQALFWQFLQKYFASAKEFEIRFAIICAIRNYFDDAYIDQVLDIFESLKSDFYYVNMGVAWALQIAFIKYKEKIYCLFKKRSLSKEITNKAIQKIRESRRVSALDKAEVLNYKIV